MSLEKIKIKKPLWLPASAMVPPLSNSIFINSPEVRRYAKRLMASIINRDSKWPFNEQPVLKSRRDLLLHELCHVAERSKNPVRYLGKGLLLMLTFGKVDLYHNEAFHSLLESLEFKTPKQVYLELAFKL